MCIAIQVYVKVCIDWWHISLKNLHQDLFLNSKQEAPPLGWASTLMKLRSFLRHVELILGKYHNAVLYFALKWDSECLNNNPKSQPFKLLSFSFKELEN